MELSNKAVELTSEATGVLGRALVAPEPPAKPQSLVT